jgi:hypothetical protein
MSNSNHSFLYRNSLAIVPLVLFLLSWIGQALFGLQQFNEELTDHHLHTVSFAKYLTTGHFFQSTFENWESEFLQMGIYVVLTIFLRQKGSAESKSLDEKEDVDREPKAHPGAPWPVRKGGIWLKLYKHSLSIAFFVLFVLSFWLHVWGSWRAYNLEQQMENKPTEMLAEYMGNSRLWFESFQNWQSEFLSIASIVVLTVFLRQQGSSESKPVDAPNDETGK